MVHREKQEKDKLAQDYQARIALTEHQYNKHMVSHCLAYLVLRSDCDSLLFNITFVR